MIRMSLAASLVAMLAGCATPPGIATEPAARTLVLEQFFVGRTIGDGVFVNTLTGAERRVHVLLDGRWNGKTLRLFEDFYFADGERQQKTWSLFKTGPNSYSGTREDVIGTAIGTQDGTQVRLAYDARLISNGSPVEVRFDDVLALQPDGSLLNKAVVSKFGVKIGDVTLRIRHARQKTIVVGG